MAANVNIILREILARKRAAAQESACNIPI